MSRHIKLDHPYSQVLLPSDNNNIPAKYITNPLKTNLQNQSKTFCTSPKVKFVDTKLVQTTTVPEMLANKHPSNIRPQAQLQKTIQTMCHLQHSTILYLTTNMPSLQQNTIDHMRLANTKILYYQRQNCSK